MYKKSLTLILALFLCASALGAIEFSQTFGSNFAYYTDDNKGGSPGTGPSWFLLPSYVPLQPEDSAAWMGGPYGYLNDDPRSRSLGSGWGSLELEAFYRFRATMPFLAGDGALTKGNNIRFEVKPIIAPVSFHVETEVRWTPIAFLQFHAGYNFGTGWPFGLLGLQGLALNNTEDITVTEESGFVSLAHMGATFQFDLGAVVPGDWTHVVISATAKVRYMDYSKADAGESWYWRADAGQNFDGWDYKGDYVLGWQPPWKVNFLGFVVEHKFWVSESIREMSTMASGGWGSDFHQWRFGPAMNIGLAEGHNLMILLQLNNGLYYTEETAYARWFQLWEYSGSKYVKFNRIALAYSWNF